MDVTDLVRRLLRNKLAVGLVVLLAIAAAATGYLSAGTSRQGGAALVIVPPKIENTAGGDNPLLNLDDNLSRLAVVLSSALQSGPVSDALTRQGATAAFTVSTVIGDNPSFAQLSPQLIFTVTGDDAAVTRRTTTVLVAQARMQLALLQDRANVPAGSRATLLEVVPPTNPEQVSGGRLRSGGALGLGVGILGLVAILVIDLLRGRAKGAPSASMTAAGSTED